MLGKSMLSAQPLLQGADAYVNVCAEGLGVKVEGLQLLSPAANKSMLDADDPRGVT